MRRVLIALALIVLAACTRVGQEQHGTGTLVIALRQEPIALNPLLLEGLPAYTISELFYSYLTNYDANGNVVSDLATYTVGPDNKTVTYHLRHGVRWQDGVPLTSRDVVFSYQAVMNPANNVETRYGYDRVASVTAPDAYTVVVRTKIPFSPIIGWFFGGDTNYTILPAHLLASFKNLNSTSFNAAPIGSGPYRLGSWDRGNRLTLRANPTYYAGKPAIDQLVLPFIADGSTTINELHTGELDAAFVLDASRIAELRAIPNHQVVVTPVPWFYGLAFNLQDSIVSDRTVREAFALAIDRRSLTRKISQGVYNADTGARGLFTWAFDPHADTIAYDPARAAALLTQDGWIPGPDGVRVKNGHKLRIELILPSGSDMTTRFATAIAAAERSVGIDVPMRRYERTQFISVEGPEMQGHYQVSLYDYQASQDPDASWLLGCDQEAPHGFDIARYCNAKVDALLGQGAATFDRAKRVAAYRAVQQQIAYDLPYFFICQISEVDVIPSNLRGYTRPLLSPFASVASWKL
jgi:peptide/nickel transport system substrate-binding protein